jgi:hypothetical protein
MGPGSSNHEISVPARGRAAGRHMAETVEVFKANAVASCN